MLILMMVNDGIVKYKPVTECVGGMLLLRVQGLKSIHFQWFVVENGERRKKKENRWGRSGLNTFESGQLVLCCLD